jgi:hypothetical protein
MDDFEYDTGAKRTLRTTKGEWYRSEYGNRWRLDDQLRDKLLELAAVWHVGKKLGIVICAT